MKTIDDLNFSGKKALIRVDYNVPLDDNQNITDDTRLKAAEKTIRKILDDNGCVILMSHLGRPKGEASDENSLRHLLDYLNKMFGTTVKFANDCIGDDVKEKAGNLQPGEILLLENLRFHKEETKGDTNFAKQLAEDTGADIYVNDAFGTAHRAHASTAVIAEYFKEKACGYVMLAEIENAEKVLSRPDKPNTAIMGGAKISDKILIIENLLDRVDHLLIGGGMSYTFIKAMGGQIGNSLVEEDKLDYAKSLIDKAKEKGVDLQFPEDSVVADEFDNNANTKTMDSDKIEEGWMGVDIGDKAAQKYSDVIKNSKTIMWNGPMGVFEKENFAKGTRTIAEAVARATEGGAFSMIGGGDSAAAINELGYENRVSFVSTGGGALLEYMEGKKLPGIAALQGEAVTS